MLLNFINDTIRYLYNSYLLIRKQNFLLEIFIYSLYSFLIVSNIADDQVKIIYNAACS